MDTLGLHLMKNGQVCGNIAGWVVYLGANTVDETCLLRFLWEVSPRRWPRSEGGGGETQNPVLLKHRNALRLVFHVHIGGKKRVFFFFLHWHCFVNVRAFGFESAHQKQGP